MNAVTKRHSLAIPTFLLFNTLVDTLTAQEHFDYDIDELNQQAVHTAAQCLLAVSHDDHAEAQHLLDTYARHFTGQLVPDVRRGVLYAAYYAYADGVWRILQQTQVDRIFPPEHYTWEYSRELNGDIVIECTLLHP